MDFSGDTSKVVDTLMEQRSSPKKRKTTYIYRLQAKVPPFVAPTVGPCYIGSTVHPPQRMANHRNHYKLYLKDKKIRCNSLYVFQHFGVDNVEMSILETLVEDVASDRLAYTALVKAREVAHINNNSCVNSRHKIISWPPPMGQ